MGSIGPQAIEANTTILHCLVQLTECFFFFSFFWYGHFILKQLICCLVPQIKKKNYLIQTLFVSTNSNQGKQNTTKKMSGYLEDSEILDLLEESENKKKMEQRERNWVIVWRQRNRSSKRGRFVFFWYLWRIKYFYHLCVPKLERKLISKQHWPNCCL